MSYYKLNSSLDEGIIKPEEEEIREIIDSIKDTKPKRKTTIKEFKICKICGLEKKINDFVINHIVERRTYYKNKCIKCYNKKSNEYYESNKQKSKERYIKLKPKYNVKIKYNTLEELEQHYIRLKNELLNI